MSNVKTIGQLIDIEFRGSYNKGYEDGIMEAVKILSNAHTANEVIEAQEPYPDGEATFSIPGNPEASFDENEAYWASVEHSGLGGSTRKAKATGWHLGYKRRPWTENDVMYLKEMFRRKYSAKKIAGLLARTPQAISTKLRFFGLTYIRGESHKKVSAYK